VPRQPTPGQFDSRLTNSDLLAPDAPAGERGHTLTKLIPMELTTIFETRAGIRSGKPCFVGTRIAVYDVLDYLASGMTPSEIVGDFPELSEKHVLAAIEFAALRERCLAAPT